MTKGIVIENISKAYHNETKVEALKNINLNIDRGELFGLIGPDGAGKTTLFRILTTLLLADTGMASVNGLNVVESFKEIRKCIGYMPGKFSLYQDLSIEENLKFFADIFGTSIEANYDTIKYIYQQIEPFKNRKAGKLSGGMKQKLALCCALIHKPEVLFLDEPTTGVDPVSRKEFWQILLQLKMQGITILVSTPYMDEASLCDRIALIQNGQIMTIDTPTAIIGAYNEKLYAAKAKENYPLLLQLYKQENVKHCYISGDNVRVIFKDTDMHIDYPEVHLENIVPTIEDCFINLMRDESN